MQQPRLTCVRSRPWRSSQAERAAPSSLDSELSTFLTDCRTGFSAKIQGMQLSRRQGSDSRVGPRMRRGRALPKDAWRLASSSPGGKATDFSSLRVLAVRSASSGGKDALLFLGFGPYVHMNANLSLCTGGGWVHCLSASKPTAVLSSRGSGVGCLWLAYLVGSRGRLRTGRLEARRFSVRVHVWVMGEGSKGDERSGQPEPELRLICSGSPAGVPFSFPGGGRGAGRLVRLPSRPLPCLTGQQRWEEPAGTRTSDRQLCFWSRCF